MLNQSTRITGTMPANAMMETIKSRFGDISVDPAKALLFPRGMLGMPDKFRFVLTGFPNPKMQQFLLLQSLDEPALSFIMLPLDLQNPIIAENDIKTACRDLQINEGNLAVLLVVSVHRSVDAVKMSVNARAPVFVDVERKVGMQHVFQQDHYKVQYML